MSALPAVDTAALGRTTIYVGDCRETLRRLPAESVHCVITSPPYYGLRDYGTGQWEGGSPDCDHKTRRPATAVNGSTLSGGKATTGHQQEGYRDVCARCGAVRVDRQIGLEASLDEYLDTMLDVFREVWRVLRDDGTLWLNIGDSYSGSGKGPTGKHGVGQHERRQGFDTDHRPAVIPAKNLMMIPARLALGLQADGWTLRSDIAWCKAAPMPESVTDRPTSAWEHIFLFAKQGRYFYDAEAVREPGSGVSGGGWSRSYAEAQPAHGDGDMGTGRNLWNYWRDLDDAWLLGPEPFPESHFAVFPTEIPRRAILAGTSARGCCPRCGAPWQRVVERITVRERLAQNGTGLLKNGKNEAIQATGVRNHSLSVSHGQADTPTVTTTGWQPACHCNAGEPIPATVLDPFGGAGTTALVANRNGRHAILCELSPTYAGMAARRIRADLGLLAAVDVMDSLEVA